MMIISGFPGIGKSTLVRNAKLTNRRYIDLESSTFHNESKPSNWAEYYIRTAIDLHNQDFCVFVACHDDVRDQLYSAIQCGSIDAGKVAVMFPSKNIAAAWIDMLEERYNKTKSEKDKRAYNFFKEKGCTSIGKLEKSDRFNKIIIDRTPDNYGCCNYLDDLISQHTKRVITEIFV